jgi:pimeloyl-ACP methyl ester carboxylesterase
MVTCHDRKIRGVATTRYSAGRAGCRRPPIVMVHGGNHAGWVWDHYARYLAEDGWDCWVFDWLQHGRSAKLPPERFVTRGILDVATRELPAVLSGTGVLGTRWFRRPPIVVGHSMGALAAMAFAAEHQVRAVALLCPAAPLQIQFDPIPVPVDLDRPLDVPPFEQAKGMFFTTMSTAEARQHYELLEPESPRAVWETTRFTTWCDLAGIDAPVLTLAAEQDALLPPPTAARLAELLGAEFDTIPGVGHSDLLLKETGWELGARRLREFVGAHGR